MGQEGKSNKGEGKVSGERVWKGIRRGAVGAGRWLSKQTRITALKGQILKVNRQKEPKFKDIGKIVYELYQKNRVRNPDLLAVCKELKEMDKQISQFEKEIDEISKEEEFPEEELTE